MQRFTKTLATIMLMAAVVYAAGCNKDDNSGNDGGGNNGSNDNEVCVITYTPQDITPRTAVCGGEVIESQGFSFSELGVCWSTMSMPTVRDAHISTMAWIEPFVCTITGLEPATTYHVRAYVRQGESCFYGEDKSFTTNDVNISGTGTYLGHDYIDLGLPSGTLWATCNVGATTPEGYGDYFAWGETQPKDNYSWSTYRYCMGSENTLTKYCNNEYFSYNGYADYLAVLQPNDDAAKVNWGYGWCMPSKDQWWELRQNTTQTWTTQNGINGYLFTARNGNGLFLPVAGYRWDYDFYHAGSSGHYWSRSLYTDGTFYEKKPYNAWNFRFYSGYCGMDSYYRKCGLSVRPVRQN